MAALGRQRHLYFSDFKASLVYTVKTRTARATQRSPVSKHQVEEGMKEEYIPELESSLIQSVLGSNHPTMHLLAHKPYSAERPHCSYIELAEIGWWPAQGLQT